ncbi:MAG: diguanylate cyclase [Actinomycetia bacterium]|nr:diguanylate cyclase [Actinomycetes bacterium]
MRIDNKVMDEFIKYKHISINAEPVAEKILQDQLTSLYNRHYFYQIISKKINRAARIGYKLVPAVKDINNFKTVNNRLGHNQGDQLLVELGQI